MRLGIFVVAIVAMVPVISHAAETFDNPKALVTAIFARYQPGQLASDPTGYYSEHLKALFDNAVANNVFTDDAAMAGAEFTPAAVFNPFLPDDKSALLFDLAVGEPTTLDNRAVVTVSYHNFDQPRLLSIAMVREGDSWKVDDVASLGTQDHWLLSWALAHDPTGF